MKLHIEIAKLIDKWLPAKLFTEHERILANQMIFSLCEQYANQSKWISVEDGTPEMLEGENYSKNVFAICKELHGLQVFCYCYNPSETDNERGFFWANCYQNIDGECEFDDNYTITHWQKKKKKP